MAADLRLEKWGPFPQWGTASYQPEGCYQWLPFNSLRVFLTVLAQLDQYVISGLDYKALLYFNKSQGPLFFFKIRITTHGIHLGGWVRHFPVLAPFHFYSRVTHKLKEDVSARGAPCFIPQSCQGQNNWSRNISPVIQC